ncbi:glycosyl transferase family 1 [Bacillus sp. MKU004]|nr:glycosyl transferase family 1 [Bacillus sp. MKU004]
MKKVLFVATVVRKHINVFHLPYLKWFQENGYETHVCAGNDFEKKDDLLIPYCNKYYDLPFMRSPFKLENINIYKRLKKIIDENDYDIIHCHTPMGGVLTRLAARISRNKGTKVIYTAHGFHFFKGAPIKNWLLYYPIERWLARFTDVLITINKEDFYRAKKFKTKKVEYVPGVGIDLKKFDKVNINKEEKRRSIGIKKDDFLILSIGELNKNKNHKVIINAISKIKNQQIKYVICGQGPMEHDLRLLAQKLNVDDKVYFIGYRSDIPELCKAADLFAFPSYREGLSLSLMEAIASGLPIVCSNIRGNSDLVNGGKGGYLIEPDDVSGFKIAINKIIEQHTLRENMIKENIRFIDNFSLQNTKSILAKIYKGVY